MFKLKEKLNKFNILSIVSVLLLSTVIGQSIYIARLYSNNQGVTQQQNNVENNKLSGPRSIFDDFDNDFMSNHFKEFRKIKEHMDKVFDDAFSEFSMHPGINNDFNTIFGSTKATNNLNLDLQNAPDKFTVTLRLPNSQKSNVNVELKGQRLTVSGDVKEKIEESNDFGGQYREYTSKFTRSIILPEKVKEDSLATKFDKDKLIITVSKS